MKNYLFLLASAVSIHAQDKIADVLATEGKLSTLSSILYNNPALSQLLDDKSYGQRTFLAPSDIAFAKYVSGANITSAESHPSQTQMEAMLAYHIMNGSFPASSLASPGGVAASTFLQDTQYTNLGPEGRSGNVVYASKYGSSGEAGAAGKLEVFGGVGGSAPIVRTDIQYGNGYVHVVDDLLPLPQTCTGSMGKLSLTSLLQALNRAALAQTIDTTPGVTCFAPTQEAFAALGNPEGKLSPAELSGALMLHTLGKAAYSPELKTGTSYPTLAKGQSIKVSREGGSLYVSGSGGGKAKVVRGNVIVKNGVMHVIDQVCTPHFCDK
ncbi:Fasciclin-domain-containing protein [Choiromyces venosus 120613-1]|uniref:Fasciclin-domain-containing protein n=1 Tax=Choiromyces venosus 120613-1 TaxID=1336337 RepID=A0A3N4K1K0_9PEZI|nr:Fasciclin-domain-containing protein [Choiromyces venosus 120613-1]